MVVMKEEKFYEMLAKVRDFANGISEAVNDYLQACNKDVQTQPRDYDVSKLKWQERKSSRDDSMFQIATASDHKGNADFEKLFAHLKEHERGIQIGKGEESLFYWIMTGGQDIGRKKTSFKQK